MKILSCFYFFTFLSQNILNTAICKYVYKENVNLDWTVAKCVDLKLSVA